MRLVGLTQLAAVLAGAAALALVVMVHMDRSPPTVAEARLSMLEYKANLPDNDPFADFDKGFKAGPYHNKKEKNVLKNFDRGYHAPPYRSLEEMADEQSSFSAQLPTDYPFETASDEQSPFAAPLPTNYPFDETAGGHVWKHWGEDGDSPMQALRERNVMDDGTTTDAAYQLGDHTLGRPFVKFKPDRNVFESLTNNDEEPHAWAAYKPERNVLSSLSPDSGYDAPEAKR
ncbi:hypothetical protein T484DRAFT_1826507 [Baffinella frigidus]|nr:hypothetical protein T484DRAFT_1826507 [Cryptophyta sp. CCMP2293]